MDRPIDRVLERLKVVKTSGDTGTQWTALCPAHPDKKESLAIAAKDSGKVVVKCYAGCEFKAIVEAMKLEFKDFFPPDSQTLRQSGISIERMAMEKRLPSAWLRSEVGLREAGEHQRRILIPYRSIEDKEMFCRERTALKAKDGTYQPRGTKLEPYGLWRLKAANRQRLIIVEGETDCWALWFHGHAALGLPGAEAIKCLETYKDILKEFQSIIVWREPGDAGTKFATKLTLVCSSLGVPCVVAQCDGIKDPADVNTRFADAFTRKIEEIVAAAAPLVPESKDAGPKKKSRIVPQDIPPLTMVGGVRSPLRELTDAGNAQRFYDRHGQDVRWVSAFGKWFIWDGVTWGEDEYLKAQSLCVETMKTIYGEAAAEQDEKLAEEIYKHAETSCSDARVQSCLRLVRSLPDVPVSARDFDRYKNLLTCPNGVVDLRTGEMRPHLRSDLLTKVTSVEYDPAAKCPIWKKFLASVFSDADGNPDQTIIDYVQCLLGLGVTGESDSVLPIFFGDGSNGKSLLLKVIQEILGGGFVKSAPYNFGMNLTEQHPTAVADLWGTRLFYVNETESNRKLNSGFIKQLTGGDVITARRMGKDFFEFEPTHTIVMCTNHMPRVVDNDDGIWRRIALVPFRVRFWREGSDRPGPEHLKADPNLIDKLKEDYRGILAWLVQGAMRYYKDRGLPASPVIAEFTEDYRESENNMKMYMDDRCQKTDPGEGSVLFSEIYKDYCDWCAKQKDQRCGRHQFSAYIKKAGYVIKKSHGQQRVYDIEIKKHYLDDSEKWRDGKDDEDYGFDDK